ncbi:MAG TPA: hypothetical protein VJI12_04075 [archaeon]|nr:hypothetical protein [archaeon]
MKYEETDLDKPIFVVMVVLSVILISKIVFWISIGCFIAGVIWYTRARNTKQSSHAFFMLAISLFLIPVTYLIGYRIENVPMFNIVFDYARSFLATIF